MQELYDRLNELGWNPDDNMDELKQVAHEIVNRLSWHKEPKPCWFNKCEEECRECLFWVLKKEG